jgi:hypothetical protein
MKSTALSLDHPIIFLEDFDNPNLQIPEYSEQSVTAATPSCVSVRVVCYVDGEVTVRLVSEPSEVDLDRLVAVFLGTIETPNRRVAVVTSENEKSLEIEVPNEVTRMRVFVNRTDFPDEVIVVVEAQPTTTIR